jgi:segregation and condensation protein B
MQVPEQQEFPSLRPLIEAVLFASPEPVTVRQLARALIQDEAVVVDVIESIVADYSRPEHGVFVRQVRGGYHFGTKPDNNDALHSVLRRLRPPVPLSLAALQTLAIIAYRQPISAPEIQAIRRVEGAGVLQTLLKRKLIAPAGRKDDTGHALLYKTTRSFLVEFGLKDLKDLPALIEFAELRHFPK